MKGKTPEHGIGTKSIRKVVEKYDGVIEFKDEAKRFEASAIIYGLQDNKNDFSLYCKRRNA